MKIPKTLPQFSDEVALLIVTGKQSATMYVVAKGEAVTADVFEIPRVRPGARIGEELTAYLSSLNNLRISSTTVRQY